MNNYINQLIRRFIWTRTNTIELFKMADKANIFDYKPNYLIENPAENHNLIYQFQCILTSCNAHYRRLRNEENIKFGIYINDNNIIKKSDIKKESIIILLEKQIQEAQDIIKSVKEIEKLFSTFITIIEHESLHQGQLIVMFRETKIDFPKEFKTAWNL